MPRKIFFFIKSLLLSSIIIGNVFAAEISIIPLKKPFLNEEAQIANWIALAEEKNIELAICITSALRFGMLDAAEATRHECAAATINPAFIISGLGDLVDACNGVDRLVTFGG